ncbi:MAG TPA: opioid growth factor receptor-related protein [Acidobacteriaceae bacterium]|jgi:hypothetical protein|nr:opioid growth factor receptor-related protein [Acidobacteriaceae bacterium]
MAGSTHPAAHPIVAFYRDGATDDRNRTLAQILDWDDDRLEDIHDFIQWLFPLPETSGANPSAPTLDAHTITAFHATPEMQQRLRQSLDRMLRFYGFAWATGPTPTSSAPPTLKPAPKTGSIP